MKLHGFQIWSKKITIFEKKKKKYFQINLSDQYVWVKNLEQLSYIYIYIFYCDDWIGTENLFYLAKLYGKKNSRTLDGRLICIKIPIKHGVHICVVLFCVFEVGFSFSFFFINIGIFFQKVKIEDYNCFFLLENRFVVMESLNFIQENRSWIDHNKKKLKLFCINTTISIHSIEAIILLCENFNLKFFVG